MIKRNVNDNNIKANKTWFYRLIFDSKAVTSLVIILLLLLIILILTKVSYIFQPVGQFLGVIGLPVIMAAVFYYLLKPIVDFADKKGVSRMISTIIVFVVLVALMAWGLIVLIPNIEKQITSFMNNVPNYVNIIDEKVQDFLTNPMYDSLRPQVDEFTNNINQKIVEYAKDFSTNAFVGVSSFVGKITSVLVGIITMPFILFYLLTDGEKLVPYVVSFLPIKWRKQTANVLKEVDSQISSYIRGQIIVALCVAILFIIGFNIIGLDYAITLGVVAGLLNMIPYLGSFLAMVPAIILGIVAGPVMLIKVIVVFVIEQTLEGRVISPQVLGSQLKIHPITIIFVLLTSGKLFGVLGVIVGIPVYASVKVVISHFFNWYRNISGLYEDDNNEVNEVTDES